MTDNTTVGAGAGVDPGPGGFMSIFEVGESAGAGTQTDITQDSESQDTATSARTSSPETTHDDGYTTADDVVAARLAASLAADGIEVPQPDDEGEESEAGDDGETIDLANLSEDEIRALFAEAQRIKREQSASAEQAEEAEVRAEIAEAEARAVEAVVQQFQQHVLYTSESHYRAQLSQRVATIVRNARSQDNPDQYIVQQVLAEAGKVFAAKQKWEQEQAQDWDQRAVNAALEARKQSPKLRALFARRLAGEFNLPDAAIAEIQKQRDIDTFRQRAEELAGLAAVANGKQQKQTQQQRESANKALREQPIRTTPTARVPGGKPPEYKGTAQEGLAILSLMHAGS